MMRNTTTSEYARGGGAAPRRTAAGALRLRRAGFTLPEVLTVIAIIGLLMGASIGSLNKARTMAKRTKAEAQLREMINAWKQYYTAYGAWPSSLKLGSFVPMTASAMSPLTDPENGDNKDGVVFFNYAGSELLDPWQTPYRLSFGELKSEGGDSRYLTTFEATVALPRRGLPNDNE